MEWRESDYTRYHLGVSQDVLFPCFWVLGFLRVLGFANLELQARNHACEWGQGAMEDGEEGAQGQGGWHRLQGALATPVSIVEKLFPYTGLRVWMSILEWHR